MVRIGASSTLPGRPVMAIEDREILNYADQGIGADVRFYAVTSMPKHVFDHVILLIYAQILMCVLLGQEKERKAELARAMLSAADRFLSHWGIPAEVEAESMTFWESADMLLYVLKTLIYYGYIRS